MQIRIAMPVSYVQTTMKTVDLEAQAEIEERGRNNIALIDWQICFLGIWLIWSSFTNHDLLHN